MNNIEKYFIADRFQLGIGIIIAIFSLVIAAFLFASKKAVFVGMSYSIIPLALIIVVYLCISIL